MARSALISKLAGKTHRRRIHIRVCADRSVFRTGMHKLYAHDVEMILSSIPFTKHATAEQVIARNVVLGRFHYERAFDIRACYARHQPAVVVITLQFAGGKKPVAAYSGSVRIFPFCTIGPTVVYSVAGVATQ